ncbi:MULTISPECIES: YciI family protein [Halocynthiibacter]|uniref:YciI family protein n=1 Tax=Halocynthiibacter halioticoli TaxID=2986804 RepID=A0AAE3LRI9_9RHOB|nr:MULTISPECIES: YciI family protein [Halocynthiibacter]MCV6825642.1 YciI family protein [Halocynthiibacter halioticoli]MCW4058643.1 YciI family protein [Halocynthiibacter sp. SDUM655004]MDE0591033.1 YciI family protein [Halocynthiibacter sp. C4]
MYVALIAKDKPGALEVRKANRDAHVAYLKETGVVQAGPFLDSNGDMCGSLVILDMESIEDAQKWAENDPYAKAGLFESVDLQLWNRVIG